MDWIVIRMLQLSTRMPVFEISSFYAKKNIYVFLLVFLGI